MADNANPPSSNQEEAVVTDDALTRARSRIGAEMRVHAPFNEEVTRDGIRHFAHGGGDDNPLFCDRSYASGSRWGSVIAPPMFYRSTGLPEKTEWTDEERALARDPLSGIHAWYSGDAIHWLEPIRPGDRVTARRFWRDFAEKHSSFAGRTIIEVQRTEYRNQHSNLVVVSDMKQIRGGRQNRWGERTKYAQYERPTYSAEDIRRIDTAYAKECRRGASSRCGEDVKVGDVLPPIVKGPITVTDIMNWNMGWGLVMFQGAHRLASQWRKKHPKAYLPNGFGVPDVIEAVHWDDDLAQHTGNPYAYDYGGQRIAWMAQIITDWMGDDAWLWSMDCEIRRFVYVGDTVWVRGRVVDKNEKSGAHVVEIEVEAEDHRRERTAFGRAAALLPSRRAGLVQLPLPPESL